MEYGKYLEGNCVYNVKAPVIKIEILVKGEKNSPICTQVVWFFGEVATINCFSLWEKYGVWFFSQIRIFPPDEEGYYQATERLSDKKEVAQAIFLDRISRNCCEQNLELEKRVLRAVLMKNLPGF